MRKITLLLVYILLSSRCSGVVFHVNWDGSGDFTTIQAGIDAASDGDEVEVADGTYTGDGNRDIDFSGKAITVRSAGGAYKCIIDCQASEEDSHRGFNFVSGEDANSVVDGFTIINGYGGGVAIIEPLSPGSYISMTTASAGGGILCKDSSPVISNCIIKDNVALVGGGVFCSRYSPRFSGCEFVYNSSVISAIDPEDGGAGGAMYNFYSQPRITNCTFRGNLARLFGGAVLNVLSDAEITNCTFTGNQCEERGGGIFSAIAIYSGDWHNSKIIGDGSVLTNCILWNNWSEYGLEIFAVPEDPFYPKAFEANNCCLQGLSGTWGAGNIGADPLFVDPGYWDDHGTPTDPNDDFWVDGDYRLQAGSPCIDAGDPNYVGGPDETDIDGNVRVVGGRIDIGAYEYVENAIETVESEMLFVPRVINRESRGKFVMGIMDLPDGIEKGDVDDGSFVLYVDGDRLDPLVPVMVRINASRHFRRIFVVFDRADFVEALPAENGSVEVGIEAALDDGRYLYGSDTVRLVTPRRRQPNKPPKRSPRRGAR